MAIPTLPPAPSRTDTPAVYVPKADAWVAALPPWTDAANATAAEVVANQIIASNAASAAAIQASIAASAADAAAISAGATLWVSGTTYTIGQKVISPANTLTYIRKTNGSGTTDPSLDSTNWNPAVSGISRFTTATSSVVYTALTIGYITTAMTVIGQSITLPAANTISNGVEVAIIDNTKGGYSVGVRDNTGALITSVGVGGFLSLTMKDNSTVAGVWGIEGTTLEPGLVTIDTQLSQTYLQTVYPQFISLDNDTSIHFAQLATAAGFAAFVVDNVGKVVSTPVSVTTIPNGKPLSVFKINSTSGIVFFSDNTGSENNVVVLTLTGTSPTYSLSVGTAARTVANMGSAGWGNEDGLSATRITQLTPSLYVCGYVPFGGENISAVAVNVSGTTPVIGTPLSIGGGNSAQVNSAWVQFLTSTTALIVYSSTPNIDVAAVVVSVTGTNTLTAGTIVHTGTTNTHFNQAYAYTMLTPTKMLVLYSSSTPQSFLRTVSVSGTVATWGTEFTLTPTTTQANSVFNANSATRFNPHFTTLTSTTALLWFIDQTGASVVQVITENAGVLTVGTKLLTTFQQSGLNSMVLPASNNEFVALSNSLNSSGQKQLIPHSINGTNVNSGNFASLTSEDDATSNTTRAFVKLPSGDYCLNVFNGIVVLRSNGFNINKRGLIPLRTRLAGLVKNQVSPTRIVVLNPTWNTVVPNGSYFLSIVNMEIAV